MKYVNDLPVYEEEDACSLDEYSVLMAEKLHQKIEKAKYDDTGIKKDTENLQKHDTKQDELISKIKNALIHIETEKSKNLNITDASEIQAQLIMEGNHEQNGTPSPDNPVPIVCLGSNTDGSFKGSTEIKISNEAETEEISKILHIQQEMLKGDYFVKESDGWKEVHSYSKKIFNGTEAWNLESLSQGNNFYTNIPDALGDTTAPVYSNCFMYYNGLLDKNYSCRISGSKNLNLRCNEKNTVEEFKQMLADKYNAGNPVYAFYKTETSTKLSCTEDQSAILEELNNLDLFEGVNNIITVENVALLKLNYIADTKTYIDNKLNIINQQILEIAGGNG